MDTYSSNYAAVGGIIGVLLGLMFIMIIFIIIAVILQVIGQWKMFKKANEEGWKALIPIYNTYTLCKLVGVSPWWILITILSPILALIPIIGSLLSYAISIYFTVILVGSTAKSYGKDTGWAVGLALLNPFFTFALGVGKSEYQGPKSIGDPIMDKIIEITKQTENTNTNSVTTPDNIGVTKFCSNCGTKIDQDTKFCQNCGKKI